MFKFDLDQKIGHFRRTIVPIIGLVALLGVETCTQHAIRTKEVRRHRIARGKASQSARVTPAPAAPPAEKKPEPKTIVRTVKR